MTTYKVGYFVGSLSSKSINRILSKALIRLAPHDLEFSEIPIGDLPLYSPDYDDNYPPEADRLEGSDRPIRRCPLRHPRVQPIHPRCIEECNRLGVAALGPELLRPHSRRRHWGIQWADRHSGQSAKPARCPQLLQCPSDDRAGGLHPIHTGDLHRRWRGHRRRDGGLPEQLHERVPHPSRSGADGHPATVTKRIECFSGWDM